MDLVVAEVIGSMDVKDVCWQLPFFAVPLDWHSLTTIAQHQLVTGFKVV